MWESRSANETEIWGFPRFRWHFHNKLVHLVGWREAGKRLCLARRRRRIAFHLGNAGRSAMT